METTGASEERGRERGGDDGGPHVMCVLRCTCGDAYAVEDPTRGRLLVSVDELERSTRTHHPQAVDRFLSRHAREHFVVVVLSDRALLRAPPRDALRRAENREVVASEGAFLREGERARFGKKLEVGYSAVSVVVSPDGRGVVVESFRVDYKLREVTVDLRAVCDCCVAVSVFVMRSRGHGKFLALEKIP